MLLFKVSELWMRQREEMLAAAQKNKVFSCMHSLWQQTVLILFFTGLEAHLTENFQEEAVRRLAEEEAERQAEE